MAVQAQTLTSDEKKLLKVLRSSILYMEDLLKLDENIETVVESLLDKGLIRRVLDGKHMIRPAGLRAYKEWRVQDAPYVPSRLMAALSARALMCLEDIAAQRSGIHEDDIAYHVSIIKKLSSPPLSFITLVDHYWQATDVGRAFLDQAPAQSANMPGDDPAPDSDAPSANGNGHSPILDSMDAAQYILTEAIAGTAGVVSAVAQAAQHGHVTVDVEVTADTDAEAAQLTAEVLHAAADGLTGDTETAKEVWFKTENGVLREVVTMGVAEITVEVMPEEADAPLTDEEAQRVAALVEAQAANGCGDCLDCLDRRVLHLLMQSSPTIRALYEQEAARESAERQRDALLARVAQAVDPAQAVGL